LDRGRGKMLVRGDEGILTLFYSCSARVASTSPPKLPESSP
jgi:ribosomal protein L24E